MEIKLEYCPCCGGEAEMKPTNIYMSKARAVVCKECGLRTKLIFINTPCMNSKGKPDESTRYTEEQAEKIAAELWNRRVNSVTPCSEEVKGNNEKVRINDLENQVAINKGAMRAYREAFENAHDEAVKDFSHFLIDKAKDGSIEICDLPDLVAEWRSPERKDAELMKEIGEAFQQGVEGGAEE